MKANRNKFFLAMARACLNSRELAEKTGMPRPTVNNVITGKNVRPASLGTVAKALGVDVADIIETEE